MKDLCGGTIPGPDGSPAGSRGGLRRAVCCVHISVVLVPLSVLRVPLQAGQKEKEEEAKEEGAIRDLRRGPAGSAPQLTCTIAKRKEAGTETLAL